GLPMAGPEGEIPSRTTHDRHSCSGKGGDSMRVIVALCCMAVLASLSSNLCAQEKQALRLVQTIPLPGVKGRLDHMGVDLEKKRLFVATVDNNTLEVVDLTAGKVIKSFTGFKDTQDACSVPACT